MKTTYLILISIVIISFSNAYSQKASGYVFNDKNGNGNFDESEVGIADILVSNGVDIVKTNSNGKWELNVTDDTGIFLIKPANYSVPLSENMNPQFYYLHKPNGSPKLEKKGVAPTGKLPALINFPLIPHEKQNKFKAIFFGDTQASSPEEVHYINHDVIEELIGTEAIFGASLGDIVGHDLDLIDEINQGIGQIGIPWYNIFGNHDNNRDALSNKQRDETFEKYFGPSTYAFEYGQVSFISYNTVYFDSTGKYYPRFLKEYVKFLENYLKFIPNDQLIVLLMHIPIFRAENREKIFDLLDDREFTFSISGHVHDQLNVFVDEKYGWKGKNPHHHLINATVCGSWWAGQKDEVGIPHATMNDGAPNGYSIISFDGNRYSIRFKAARRPENYQMNIYAPNTVKRSELDTTQVLVNVFAGSEKSIVKMQVGKSNDWTTLKKTDAVDPACLRMYEISPILNLKYQEAKLENILGWPMDKPHVSHHMWKGLLPTNLKIGSNIIKIRTTDMYGQTNHAYRILYIKE